MSSRKPSGWKRKMWDRQRLPRWLPRWAFYIRLRTRFIMACLMGLTWAGVSLYISLPWIEDLGEDISIPLAVITIFGIAIIPGYLNAYLLGSLLFDRPPRLRSLGELPNITLLIAAYNEQDAIAETLRYALEGDYPGEFKIIVIDDGSEDNTREVVERFITKNPDVRLIQAEHGGKASALNVGLAAVDTELIATVDADTLLMPQALQNAVTRMACSPEDTVAVAGSVLVRNSRGDVLTRMQEWDYLLGIASVKRTQGLIRSTLVAQGAFSIYKASTLRAVGGWPKLIGEDIVLTWALLKAGGRTVYEPTAVAYTVVPAKLRALVRQRQRWARGMIEGLRTYGGSLVGKFKLFSYAIAIDWFFPYLDLVFTVAVPIGLVLAVFGNFALIGPMTLAILPLNAMLALFMYVRQRVALREIKLIPRRNRTGFVLYFLFYQLLMSPISLSGYTKELVHTTKRW